MGENTDPMSQHTSATDRQLSELAGNDAPSVEEQRAHIEQTRAEMSETIDELQQRISPEHIQEQIVERTREATVDRAQQLFHEASHTAKRAGTTIVEFAKQNPFTAGFVAVVVSWLMFRGIRGASK